MNFPFPFQLDMSNLNFDAFVQNYVAIGIFLLILLALVSYYVWHLKLKEGFDTKPSNDPNTKDVELYFFSTDWCPHCKTAKPEWESVKSEMDGTKVNGKTLRFKDVNCTTESPDTDKLMKTFSVDGYPTIKLVKEGVVSDYDAKVTKETLTQFINSTV
jgi:thiol-disulfide isomerase/thioredoxin